MIINSAPSNEAILSNVSAVGEFRIRNSAKAFNILSSGLYANKIRAIIRELSTNAVDSHIDAGNDKTPFDIHLPNSLEPWFSIRDYGTGLTHEQVTNIYTTYFESTKTDSNAFIGALGLGSKSPFSYTDNFTVTAIKNGHRGIYSAFINEQGVPSIALMMEEESTDPSGVEVKFSVNDRYDFDKFKSEARTVYTYFKLRPVVSGSSGFQFVDLKYSDKDIVPGVHSTGGNNRSIAIMGNIAYPIDIPSSDTNIGEYRNMLNCGLEMHFDIGELDFQASREGLSYIPETVVAIRKKLEVLTGALPIRLAVDADKIANLWDRALFLNTKKDSSLWSAAVTKYVTDTKFPLMVMDGGRLRLKNFVISEKDMASKYNINMRAFTKHRSYSAASNRKPHNEYGRDAAGKETVTPVWSFSVGENTFFIENDTKVGALVRAKYHWKHSTRSQAYSEEVHVMEKADKKMAMNIAAFLKAIASPPANRSMLASTMLQKERAVTDRAKNVTIMRMERKDNARSYRRRYGGEDMVWRDAGKADAFDKKTTYYYMPLSGYTMESTVGYQDAKTLHEDMSKSGVPGIADVVVYGVRKGDIEFIKTQKNWINIETFIVGKLAKIDDSFLMGLVMSELDRFDMVRYNVSLEKEITDKESPYVKFALKFKDVKEVSYSEYNLNRLCQKFAPNAKISTQALKAATVKECQVVYDSYPLFKNLSYGQNNAGVAEYINLINASKKEIK